MLQTLVTILIVMALTPFVVYLAAKLGAYGFLRGWDLYDQHHYPLHHLENEDNYGDTQGKEEPAGKGFVTSQERGTSGRI